MFVACRSTSLLYCEAVVRISINIEFVTMRIVCSTGPFFLSATSLFFCCMWSYKTKHRHTRCRTPLGEWSACRRNLYVQQQTELTRDKQRCFLRDSNPQFQRASGHRLTPWTAKPLGSAFFSDVQNRIKESGLEISEAVSVVEWFLAFRRIVLPSLKRSSSPRGSVATKQGKDFGHQNLSKRLEWINKTGPHTSRTEHSVTALWEPQISKIELTCVLICHSVSYHDRARIRRVNKTQFCFMCTFTSQSCATGSQYTLTGFGLCS